MSAKSQEMRSKSGLNEDRRQTRAEAQSHRSLGCAVQTLHVELELLGIAKQRICSIEQLDGFLRRRGAARVLLEQDDVELILKEFDLPAERGLGDVQNLGGSIEILLGRERDEVSQLSQIHDWLLHSDDGRAPKSIPLPVIGGRGFLYLMHSGRGLKWECTGRKQTVALAQMEHAMKDHPVFGSFGRFQETPKAEMPPDMKAAFDFISEAARRGAGSAQDLDGNPMLSETIVPTGAYFQTKSTLGKAEIEIVTNVINGRWLAAYLNYEHEMIGENLVALASMI